MVVSGYHDSNTMCFEEKPQRSLGIFYGDNPFHYHSTLLLAQLSISALLTSALQFLISPLGQTSFVAQTLVGLALSPSVFGKAGSLRELIFPVDSLYVGETVSYFGLMLFLFLVGVKMEFSSLRKSGKRAIVTGICSFLIPLVLNLALAFLLLHSVTMDPVLHRSLLWIASFESISSFHVISCLLHDLKLLNSELGRLAIPASHVSGVCSSLWIVLGFIMMQVKISGRNYVGPQMAASAACLIAVIVYIFRPLLLWIARRSCQDKAIKEAHILLVFIMILGSSMAGEIIGQHSLFGPMILGLAVPEGPPLGTALVAKLDTFVSSMLLPIFFVINGAFIDFSGISFRTFGIVELLALLGFFWKVLAVMVPSLYYKMSVKDAASLGLVMSAQGFIEVLGVGKATKMGLIDSEIYTIMSMSILVISAATGPLLKVLYKPSTKYIAHKRRTIEHAKPSAELRLLACIFHEDQTPSIINLLEASNPTPNSPIFFYPIHLIELTGRSAPVLVAHQLGTRTGVNSHESDHIINAFRLYEQHNQGTVVVNPFTSISYFETMHDEVCALALDKKVSMVILPFHKSWVIEEAELPANSVRGVNRNILRMAPCSVGILVDRGTLGISVRGTLGSNVLKAASRTSDSICVIFLGGQDDREALAYANRMAKHPNVTISIVRLVEYSIDKFKITHDTERDIELINEFRVSNALSESCDYREEAVSDGVDVVRAVRAVENSFDLILVGRQHSRHSALLHGLQELHEFPELGFFGDMLCSSDSTCRVSVLVVQQGNVGGKTMIESPKFFVVDVSSHDNAKVWPTKPHRSTA